MSDEKHRRLLREYKENPGDSQALERLKRYSERIGIRPISAPTYSASQLKKMERERAKNEHALKREKERVRNNFSFQVQGWRPCKCVKKKRHTCSHGFYTEKQLRNIVFGENV